MTVHSNRLRRCLSFGRSGAIIAAIPLACAIGIWSSWRSDNAVLQGKSLAVVAGLSSASERIWAINDWVYHHQGFGKNHRFFVVPALGPTPIQVMEAGGDCADKSRLVSAMLRELGIDSGLVMIYPCPDCAPIHTVVEARYESGRMVVDPIWDVDYPSGQGKFLGVHDLAGTRLGPEHIAELQRQSRAGDKIKDMPATDAFFDFAAAVNWNKNVETRAIEATFKLAGYEPDRLLRPHILEDPKLFLITLLILFAVFVFVASLFIGLMFPTKKCFPRGKASPDETLA